jgi:hypothetical protein
MRQTLHLELDVEFFQLEQIEQAEALAQRQGGVIYTWKTIGIANWLEQGPRCVDALGLVVLPASLPHTIDMRDDAEEEGVTFP